VELLDEVREFTHGVRDRLVVVLKRWVLAMPKPAELTREDVKTRGLALALDLGEGLAPRPIEVEVLEGRHGVVELVTREERLLALALVGRSRRRATAAPATARHTTRRVASRRGRSLAMLARVVHAEAAARSVLLANRSHGLTPTSRTADVEEALGIGVREAGIGDRHLVSVVGRTGGSRHTDAGAAVGGKLPAVVKLLVVGAVVMTVKAVTRVPGGRRAVLEGGVHLGLDALDVRLLGLGMLEVVRERTALRPSGAGTPLVERAVTEVGVHLGGAVDVIGGILLCLRLDVSESTSNDSVRRTSMLCEATRPRPLLAPVTSSNGAVAALGALKAWRGYMFAGRPRGRMGRALGFLWAARELACGSVCVPAWLLRGGRDVR
jgi:hypothetical protein